jgi:hypothetical protein
MTTTAIALPERVPALLRIYDDLITLAALVLHNSFRRGDRRKPPSLDECRRMVEQYVVWNPSNPGVPFVAHAPFGVSRQTVGWSVTQKRTKDGNPIFEGDKPKMILEPVTDLVISCEVNMPSSKDGARQDETVIPLIVCNGSGGMVPYAIVDEAGELLPCAPMLCIFVRDFDPHDGSLKGRVRAIPLGLAKLQSIELWNAIVKRMAGQGGKSWEVIAHIPNNLLQLVQYIKLAPGGPAATGGQMPLWKRKDNLDPAKPDFYILERLGGKAATLDRQRSRSIIIRGEGRDAVVPEQVFHIKEGWNSVSLRVWGLPGQLGEINLRELEIEQASLDALALFGQNLYMVNPRSGVAILRKALEDPPMEQMVAWGLIPPDSDPATARSTLHGMRAMVCARVEEQVTTARDDLVKALGPGSGQAHSLTLQDILGDEPTSELLRTAYDRVEEDPLARAIINSKTAQDLGLEVWVGNCWVLQETRRRLLLTLAGQAGIQMADPPAPTSTT